MFVIRKAAVVGGQYGGQSKQMNRGVQWVVQVVRPNHLFWGGSPAERGGWVKGGKKKKEGKKGRKERKKRERKG